MWIRLDDRFVKHPKVLNAGDALGRHGVARVIAVWLEGVTYSSVHLTDGFLARSVVRRFACDDRPLAVAAELVKSLLWEERADGFVIHDYHDYNPTADEVKQKRDDDRKRKRNPRGIQPESNRNPPGLREESRGLAGARPPSPSPSRSPSEKKSEISDLPGRFADWWRFTAYPQHRNGAAYAGNMRNDYQALQELCAVFPLERLKELAEVFLQIPADRDKFLDAGAGRTIGKFRSYASKIDERLKARAAG